MLLPIILTVTILTQSGSRDLHAFQKEELRALASKSGEISAQKLIFDESAKDVPLNERAEVDMITIVGERKIARVPRFLVWRGNLKFKLNSDSTLSSNGKADRISAPDSIFDVTHIQKIELSRASVLYPGTELVVRTNPAASRGEKLFTQSCLACHGIDAAQGGAVKFKVFDLTDEKLAGFSNIHHLVQVPALDARALRGLQAYRDALRREQPVLKSQK